MEREEYCSSLKMPTVSKSRRSCRKRKRINFNHLTNLPVLVTLSIGTAQYPISKNGQGHVLQVNYVGIHLGRPGKTAFQQRQHDLF